MKPTIDDMFAVAARPCTFAEHVRDVAGIVAALLTLVCVGAVILIVLSLPFAIAFIFLRGVVN